MIGKGKYEMEQNAQFFTKVPEITNLVELKLVEDRRGDVTLHANFRVSAAHSETYASEGFAIGVFQDGVLILNKLECELAKRMGIQCDDNNKILIQ